MNTRDMKFRLALKRKDDIQLVEFTFEQLLIGAAFVWMLDNGYSREDIISTDEYTGLKDKNGKEIYKRDIERLGYTIGWHEKRGCFGLFRNGMVMSYPLCDDYLTIIGNVHQNPDLLK